MEDAATEIDQILIPTQEVLRSPRYVQAYARKIMRWKASSIAILNGMDNELPQWNGVARNSEGRILRFKERSVFDIYDCETRYRWLGRLRKFADQPPKRAAKQRFGPVLEWFYVYCAVIGDPVEADIDTSQPTEE